MSTTDRVVQVYLTAEEIDLLAVALAHYVQPDSQAFDAQTAAADVWRVAMDTGEAPTLAGPLATMLAEARP